METESKILQEALERLGRTKQQKEDDCGWDYNDGGTYGDGYSDANYGDSSN